MSDSSSKISPTESLRVKDFVLDDFSSGGAEAAPPQTAPKEAEFEVFTPPGRAPVTSGDPSLDYLFEPFYSGQPDPARRFVPQNENMEAQPYAYADLDTRDPEVVRTLREAQLAADQTRQKAWRETSDLWARSEAEAQETVAQARLEADNILAQARQREQEAADLLARAQDEAQKIRAENQAGQALMSQADEKMSQAESHLSQAHEEGFSQGRAEGLSSGREEGLREGQEEGRRLMVAQLSEPLEGISRLYEDLYKVNEPLMIELALEAATMVVNRKLEEDSRGVALEAFRTSLSFLSQAHQAEFTVNPVDLSALEEARGLAGSLINLNFVADPTLNPGDVIMRADVGQLDATVKNRLQVVLKPLNLLFRNQRPPDLTAETLDPHPPVGPPETSVSEAAADYPEDEIAVASPSAEIDLSESPPEAELQTEDHPAPDVSSRK